MMPAAVLNLPKIIAAAGFDPSVGNMQDCNGQGAIRIAFYG
jgi:hypothetical protein